MNVCENPDILRVIWFGLEIVDIVKIIIPIALIVLGIIDFSKSVITSDEGIQKKSGKLFLKRIIYAVLVFIVPWLIKVFIITLGDLSVLKTNEVNFTDCLDNANSECIDALETGEMTKIINSCDVSSEAIKKLESNNCQGEVFIVNYYDNGVDKTESVLACNDENFTFKTITNQETGCKNIKWNAKSSSDVGGFSVGVPYTFTKDFLDSINNNGRFDLVPVWSKSFTIDYYYEDGVTLYKSVPACIGEEQQIGDIYKEGYKLLSWELDKPINSSINNFSKGSRYTFNENELTGNSIKMTAVFEKIIKQNCDKKLGVIKFYDETGNKLIETIEFCEGELLDFPSYDIPGRTFTGWDFKFNPAGRTVYSANKQYSFSSAQLYSIYSNHDDKFHLIPVFK